MKHPENKARLEALNEFIDTYYGGELDQMVRQLHETIYMLHYLGPDLFGEETRLEKAFLLYCMAEALSEKQE